MNRSLPIMLAEIFWFVLGLLSGTNGFVLETGLILMWVSIFTRLIEREEWNRLDDICAPICIAALIWFIGGVFFGANGFAMLTGFILLMLAIAVDLIGRALLFILKPKGGK